MDAQIQGALDQLQSDMAQVQTVDQSAITLLNGLVIQLQNLAAQVADNPVVAQKIADLASGIQASTQGLADAVTANTPAAPVVPAA